MPTYARGDRVIIIPHRTKLPDGTIKEHYGVVLCPWVPTDITLVTGEHIDHYVQVLPTYPSLPSGYHESSLQLAP